LDITALRDELLKGKILYSLKEAEIIIEQTPPALE